VNEFIGIRAAYRPDILAKESVLSRIGVVQFLRRIVHLERFSVCLVHAKAARDGFLHHPQECLVRKARVRIPPSDVGVDPGKPGLPRVLSAWLGLPDGGGKGLPLLIDRQGMIRVLHDGADARVVEAVLSLVASSEDAKRYSKGPDGVPDTQKLDFEDPRVGPSKPVGAGNVGLGTRAVHLVCPGNQVGVTLFQESTVADEPDEAPDGVSPPAEAEEE